MAAIDRITLKTNQTVVISELRQASEKQVAGVELPASPLVRTLVKIRTD